MPQAISSLNRFPTYETREAYEAATGKPCPPFTGKAPKYWQDPDAKKAFMVGSIPYALYPLIYAGFDQVTNQPIWDQLGIPVEEAKGVNIPPTGTGQTNVEGADLPAVRCPCRELKDNEVIKMAGVPAIPKVFTAEELESTVDVGWKAAEKELLLSAARKIMED